jgi:hypothetical protein
MSKIKLIPEMQAKKVHTDTLCLDPNNPRFAVDEADLVNHENSSDPGVIRRTIEKMKNGTNGKMHDVQEVEDSILAKGWQPVDAIFVRQFQKEPDRYVVLEGNRRVCALQQLLDPEHDKCTDELRELIKRIEVMVVLPAIGDTTSEKEKAVLTQIGYLLGIRGFGSLKSWPPFAQSQQLYKRYLKMSGQNDETFAWNDDYLESLSHQMSVDMKIVKERISVYRVMCQIQDHPHLGEIEEGGGLKSNHYSFVKEALQVTADDYISMNDETMQISDESMDRLLSLANFEKKKRKESPIPNTDEWRSLNSMLKEEEDIDKKSDMLKRIEVERVCPSDVWNARKVQLKSNRWDQWLGDVRDVLAPLTNNQFDETSPDHCSTLKDVAKVVSCLEKRDEEI